MMIERHTRREVTHMADTIITPKALAEALDVDPKALRAYLRKEFARTPEAKNTSWAITPEAAEAAKAHFEAKKAKPEATPEAEAPAEA